MGYVISYGALQSLLEDSFVDWLPYNETIQRLYTSGTFWFVILLSCALLHLAETSSEFCNGELKYSSDSEYAYSGYGISARTF